MINDFSDSQTKCRRQSGADHAVQGRSISRNFKHVERVMENERRACGSG